MTQTKDFPLGHVLSITTGIVVCETTPPIDGVYEILNWMSGESLFTHQLPRVCREAAPILLAMHPQLADVDATATDWKKWLGEQVTKFGASLSVPKMNADQHEYREPISEAAEYFPPDRIVVVGT